MFERLGACYCLFWSSDPSGGQTFEVIADYETESYRNALKNSRGDDVTFCSVSRGYKPDAAGNEPVATAARGGKKIYYADLKRARLRRSEHAREFGIQSMGLVPIKGGVLEYGIPENSRLSGHTLRALLKLSMEACGADYALCWSSTLGTHLATTSSCVHPRFRETLRERQLEAEFDTLWVNASLNARSSAGALCHRNLAPVSTCMQTGEPCLVADVGASFMKRGPLAARFGIASAAFLPAAGDVIQIGKVRSSHDGTGWEELPTLAHEIPMGATSRAFDNWQASHVIMWGPTPRGDELVAVGSYEKPEHVQQIRQIKGTDDKLGNSYVTESLGIRLDRNGDGPVASALRSGREVHLDLVVDETSAYKRAALAEEFGIVNESMVPTATCVVEFGIPSQLIVPQADADISSPGAGRRLFGRRSTTTELGMPSVEDALKEFVKGKTGSYSLGVDKRVRRDQLSSSRAMLLLYGVPLLLLLWYASAIFLPPSLQCRMPELFWTPGMLMLPTATTTGNHTNATADLPAVSFPRVATVCPKPSLCAEGVVQIVLLVFARLSAFVMYLALGHVFLSKMHALIHFLSSTIIGFYVPFELMHVSHRLSGLMFFASALIHTVSHLVRWGLRGEMFLLVEKVGMSGVLAMLLMMAVVLPMRVLRLKQAIAFETRLRLHWLFVLVILACMFHSSRTAIIMACVLGMWALDYVYQLLCMTHKLDYVR